MPMEVALLLCYITDGPPTDVIRMYGDLHDNIPTTHRLFHYVYVSTTPLIPVIRANLLS